MKFSYVAWLKGFCLWLLLMVIGFLLSISFRLLVGFRVLGSMCVGPCTGGRHVTVYGT